MRLLTIACLVVLTAASFADLAVSWLSTRHVGRTER